MAKKTRRARAKKMAGEGSKRIIATSAFTQLLKDLKASEADKNEAVGRTGGLITAAVEKHNVNKKALAWYRAAERMSGAKLRDVLDQFDHYRDIGGLNERAKQQDEMFDSAERGTTANGAHKSPRFAEQLEQKRTVSTIRQRGPRNKAPTPEEVKAAADRAEARSEAELH